MKKPVKNLEKKREHLQGFIDRFGAKASKATQAQSKQKAQPHSGAGKLKKSVSS